MAAAKAPARKAKPKAAQPVSEETTASGVRPPEQFVSPEPKVDPLKSLYPDGTDLFSYTTKATGVTVWLPLKIEEPTAVQLWELYEKPLHMQTWDYMRWANVPRPIQRVIVELLDADNAEYFDLFQKWAAARGGVTPGE